MTEQAGDRTLPVTNGDCTVPGLLGTGLAREVQAVTRRVARGPRCKRA
jgi:hypothetical protein